MVSRVIWSKEKKRLPLVRLITEPLLPSSLRINLLGLQLKQIIHQTKLTSWRLPFFEKKWQVIGWIRVSKSTDRNDFTMIRCYRKLWWVLIIINVNAKMLHVKWCKYYVRFGYFVYSFMFSKSFIIVSTWFSRSHLIGKSDELPIIKKVSKVKCGSCTKMLCDRVIFMSQLKGSFILARNKV